MKFSIFIIAFLLFVSCKSLIYLEDAKSEPALHFDNQGEQENYWAKQFFKIQYEKFEYSKFIGKVRITDSEIKFGETECINYYNTKPEYKMIFEKGLLYPGLLKEDTIDICCIEELMFLSENPKIKRFRFLLSEKIGNTYLMNPSVYLFELTNEKVDKEDSWETFIEDAKLTFIKYGWSQ